MVTIGVDPGSVNVGIAFVDDEAKVLSTWPITTTAKRSRIARMAEIAGAIRYVFEKVPRDLVREVVVEEATFNPGRTSVAAMAEARGVVIALAEHRGWTVRTIAPEGWKRFLSPGERSMKKGGAYLAWMNRTRRWRCRIADEVDAAFIGQAAVWERIGRSRSSAPTRRSSPPRT